MMENSRLGCLTSSGIITASATFVILAVVLIFQGGVLLSPGALNAQPGKQLGGVASHAEIGGRCESCHAPFWDAAGMAGRCLNCHTDIAAQQTDPNTLHGSLLQKGTSGACRTCHPDHRGADASLILIDPAHFPHDKVGFSLVGKHALLKCSACHINNSFSKLAVDCYACHAKDDKHTGQFGTNCATCHTSLGWLPASFDHNLTPFPLTGAHLSLGCSACHANNVFKGTPTECFSCHAKKDRHNGQFGTDCAACHSTAAWFPATINHNLTNFPLTGAHVGVVCTACHANNVFKGTPTDCFACHAKNDKHNGQFGTSCGACHSTSAWLPANFDHSKSRFPLTGAHVNVACAKCHINNVYKGTPADCVGCHAEPAVHAGRYGTACAQCHNTSSWAFSHPSNCGDQNCLHHQGATCADCHPGGFATATCTKCHDSNNPGND
jgi:hypothetical protein